MVVAPMIIVRSPSLNLFDEEIEGKYFLLYCTTTAKKLGGYWDASIWGRLILQACNEEPFARYAIVSIAALDLAMDGRSAPPSSRRPNESSIDIEPYHSHHQFALREYGKALRLMRASPSSDEAHYVRKALISCLLIICFELYRGDPELAMNQARTAVKVLSQWLKKLQASRLSSDARSSTVVEDELVDAFARLYKGIMLFRTARPSEFSELLQPEAIKSWRDMPTTFSTLTEARKYWELHLRLALPWNHQPGYDSLQASAFPKIYRDSIRNREPPVMLPPQDDTVTVRLEEERQEHIRNIHEWLAAFEPLWEYCQTEGGADDYAGAAILKMQTWCGIISFATARTNHECHYDDFIEGFAEMVRMARNVLEISEQARTGSALFAFSIGVTNCIYFIVTKCRDRRLRREALGLLARFPRRDGVWDTAMIAAVGQWNMEKEEYGLGPNEPIPERARLRLMEVKMPTAKKEVYIRYTLMEGSVRERVMPPMETVYF